MCSGVQCAAVHASRLPLEVRLKGFIADVMRLGVIEALGTGSTRCNIIQKRADVQGDREILSRIGNVPRGRRP